MVAKPCDHAENNLKIINPQPSGGVKKQFGVCSKQVTFEKRESTTRFIEWVHLLRILGAEKIYFSFEYLHPEFYKIVNYFEEKGFVETWPYLDPSGISDSTFATAQTNLVEMNILTDCFYRVKNLYDYVVVLDFDEVIMPVNEDDFTWKDIIKRVKFSNYLDGLISQNVYYPDIGSSTFEDIPNYMYMLRHTQRSQTYSTNIQMLYKSFFRTERVLTVHNHSPLQCLTKTKRCCRHFIPHNISQSNHYRSHVDGDNFKVIRVDNTIWKYKDELIKAVQETFKETGFKP